MKELILEVDFMRNKKDGVIPALKNPPEFTIGITTAYFEGSHPDEHWFQKNTEDSCLDENVAVGIEDVKQELKQGYQYKSRDKGILTLIRSVDGSIVAQCYNFAWTATQKLLFSEDAFVEMGEFMSNGDPATLVAAGRFDSDQIFCFQHSWHLDKMDSLTENKT